MRFADVLGTGKAQLVVSPLNKTAGDGVRLTAFEIPARPQTSRWPATVLDASLNRMHNHWHTDLDRDGSPDTLTASVAGVHLIRRTKTGWSKTQIGTGIRDGKTTGAGEVKTGRSADGGRFLVTIEPMHGHTIAVYTPNPTGELWQRRVVETELSRGHAIWVANLDDDPADEIVFGPGIFVLDATDNTATTWKKYVVDNGGIATEDAVVADLNGDGHADIVAGGRATHNVKLYLNRPAK